MAKESNNLLIIIVLIIIVLLFYFKGGTLFSTITTPTIPVQPLVQYVGIFTQQNSPWYFNEIEYPNGYGRPGASGNVKILGYDVQTDILNFYSVTACLDSPPEGATPTSVDSDGCQHWNYNSQVVTGHCCTGYPNTCAYCIRDASYSGSCFIDYPVNTCYSGSITTDYGGKTKVLDSGWGCWAKFTIKKNNVILHYDEQYERNNRFQLTNEFLSMSLGDVYTFNSNALECEQSINTFLLGLNSQNFIFDVQAPAQQVFQGQNVKVQVKLTNTYGFEKGLLGNLSVTFRVPTTIGDAIYVNSQLVEIKPGDNFYLYNVSTEKVTDQITVTPKLVMLLNTSSVSGINLPEPGGAKLHYAEFYKYYPIGSFQASTTTVQINPNPLYIDVPPGGCNTLQGYSLNKDGTFCLRNDIQNITCVQLGCPVLVINNTEVAYTCTSAGVCAQTVYKYGCTDDSQCLGIGVCLANNNGDKFCVDKQIVEKLVYVNGTVSIPPPTYINKTCADFNFCSSGYTCQDKNYNGFQLATCVQNYVPPTLQNTTVFLNQTVYLNQSQDGINLPLLGNVSTEEAIAVVVILIAAGFVLSRMLR